MRERDKEERSTKRGKGKKRVGKRNSLGSHPPTHESTNGKKN